MPFNIRFPLYFVVTDFGHSFFYRHKDGRIFTYCFTDEEFAQTYLSKQPSPCAIIAADNHHALRNYMTKLNGFPTDWDISAVRLGFDPIGPTDDFEGRTIRRDYLIIPDEEITTQ